MVRLARYRRALHRAVLAAVRRSDCLLVFGTPILLASRIAWHDLVPTRQGVGILAVVAAAVALLRVAACLLCAYHRPDMVPERMPAHRLAGELVLIALASAAEELTFRGAIQPALGIWPTALVFGMIHQPGTTRGLPTSPIAAVLYGAMLGWLAQRCGLWAAVAMHVWMNATSVVSMQITARVLERRVVVALP